VEKLHAAIANYLACQRGHQEREKRILAIWRERGEVPHCRICGAPIDDDEGGLYNLDDMRDRGECRDHYCPF
jgi:uncharacterized CHY-type Zn-finger protein